MKKIMSIILVIVITAMCFTACGKNKEEREEDIQKSKTFKSKTFIITDEETGVQYIVYRETVGYCGMGGITPRYNSDGSLYISKNKEKAETNEVEGMDFYILGFEAAEKWNKRVGEK